MSTPANVSRIAFQIPGSGVEFRVLGFTHREALSSPFCCDLDLWTNAGVYAGHCRLVDDLALYKGGRGDWHDLVPSLAWMAAEGPERGAQSADRAAVPDDERSSDAFDDRDRFIGCREILNC